MLMLLASKAPSIPADFSLMLHRGGCMGPCPVSTLTIDHNGVAHFTGDQYTMIGEYQRVFSRRSMTQVIRAIEDSGFFDFHAGSANGGDGDSEVMTVHMNGKEHTVSDDGCSTPGFRKLADRIEQIADMGRFKTDIDWEQQVLVTEIWKPGSCSGAACARESINLAHESLILLRRPDGTVRVNRDGAVRLQPRRLRYVVELRSKLPPKLLRDARRAAAGLKKVRNDERPRNSGLRTWLQFVVPVGDKLPFKEAALSATASPDLLERLLDDRTYTDEAKSIRVELLDVRLFDTGPLSAGIKTGEPWPAEDIVPAAQLAKRPLTTIEWKAIAERLAALPPHDDESPELDGKSFGLPRNVYLNVVASLE